MLKKLTVIVSTLAASTSFAMTDAAPYVGVGSGVIVNTTNQSNYSGINLNGYRGIPLNVFAGYGGLVTQCFYVAAEMNATLATGSLVDSDALKSTYGASISVLPGFMLNEYALGYIRLGLITSHFTEDDATYRTGGLFGMGIQSGIAQNIDLRVEYDFAPYESITETVNHQNISITPRSDQFNIGLIYNFA